MLPLVICESMAFERPVVCSNIDAIPEALSDARSLLSRPGAGRFEANVLRFESFQLRFRSLRPFKESLRMAWKASWCHPATPRPFKRLY